MSNTLTDQLQWRRYIITELHVHHALYIEGDRPIRGEGACELIWGVPVDDRDVDRCLRATEPIPPAPRSALAPTHDGNPAVGILGLAGCMVLMGLGILKLWQIVAWVALRLAAAMGWGE